MRLTKARKQTFLAHLGEHGVAREAARAASPEAKGPDGAYKTFADERGRNPEFAAAWEEAVAEAVAKLEREAFRRAVEGWVERGVFDKNGNRVGDVVRFSDRMLELALKRHIPEYREKAELDINANVRADLRAQLEVDALARQEIAVEFVLRQMSAEERQQLRPALELMERAKRRVDPDLLEAHVAEHLPQVRERMLAARAEANREPTTH